MASTGKSVQISVRVPRHLHENFTMLKEKGYIKESLSELALKGIEQKVQEVLNKHFIALDQMSVSDAKKKIEENNS